MFGNYETSAEYPGVTVIDADTIALDQDWHSFQRDFTFWYNGNAGTYDQSAFNEAFRVGRLIRIQTTRKLRHFATITAITHPGTGGQNAQDDVLIDFTPAIPSGCLSDVNGGWIAPVSAIRYFVQNAPTGFEVRALRATDRRPIAQLIRREVLPTDKVTPLANNPGNTRAVLDYVVAFNVAFTMNGGDGARRSRQLRAGCRRRSSPRPPSTATPSASARSASISRCARRSKIAMPWTQAGCAQPALLPGVPVERQRRAPRLRARAPRARRGVRAERGVRGILMAKPIKPRVSVTPPPAPRPRRREGAVMLVVMLILMIATASAAISVHTTQSELQAAGEERIALQSRYASEAAMMSTISMIDMLGD